jgi:hypothetical protein
MTACDFKSYLQMPKKGVAREAQNMAFAPKEMTGYRGGKSMHKWSTQREV